MTIRPPRSYGPPRYPAALPGLDPPTSPAPDAPRDLRAAAVRARAALPAPSPAGGEPPDPGEVLAELPREDGTVFRVSVHRYEGRPYVRLGLWRRGFDGASWWPLKGRSASVRVREVGAVCEALADAAELVAKERAP